MDFKQFVQRGNSGEDGNEQGNLSPEVSKALVSAPCFLEEKAISVKEAFGAPSTRAQIHSPSGISSYWGQGGLDRHMGAHMQSICSA